MSLEMALAHSADKPAGKRPYFLDSQVETVLAITLAAVQELAVTRDRLDTLERLLEARGGLDRQAFDSYRPTPQVAAERGLATQEYINRVLRILQQQGQSVAADALGDVSSEDVAVIVSRDDP
jgi:hypothetical protein